MSIHRIRASEGEGFLNAPDGGGGQFVSVSSLGKHACKRVLAQGRVCEDSAQTVRRGGIICDVKGSVCFVLKFAFPPSPLWSANFKTKHTEPLTSQIIPPLRTVWALSSQTLP